MPIVLYDITDNPSVDDINFYHINDNFSSNKHFILVLITYLNDGYFHRNSAIFVYIEVIGISDIENGF